jgi:hypothetical protein
MVTLPRQLSRLTIHIIHNIDTYGISVCKSCFRHTSRCRLGNLPADFYNILFSSCSSAKGIVFPTRLHAEECQQEQTYFADILGHLASN